MRSNEKLQKRSGLTWFSIVIVVGAALWLWPSFDLRLMDRRLQTSGKVSGGEAEIVEVGWQHQGPLWILFLARSPVMAIGFDVLLHNTGTQDLEIDETFVILKDPFGREIMGEVFSRDNFYNNVIFHPGETRPFYAGNVRLPEYPFFPLTWTEAEVHIKMKPATGGALYTLYRWDDVVVTRAGYFDKNGIYTIEGEVPDVSFSSDRGGSLDPYVVVSFYNSNGDFVCAENIAVSGTKIFKTEIDTKYIANGPIASYKIHFVESVP